MLDLVFVCVFSETDICVVILMIYFVSFGKLYRNLMVMFTCDNSVLMILGILQSALLRLPSNSYSLMAFPVQILRFLICHLRVFVWLKVSVNVYRWRMLLDTKDSFCRALSVHANSTGFPSLCTLWRLLFIEIVQFDSSSNIAFLSNTLITFVVLLSTICLLYSCINIKPPSVYSRICSRTALLRIKLYIYSRQEEHFSRREENQSMQNSTLYRTAPLKK